MEDKKDYFNTNNKLILDLTINERLECYELALARIIHNYNSRMCFAIVCSFEILYPSKIHSMSIVQLMKLFPEFMNYKPELILSGEEWFPSKDKESRIKLLKKVIEDTKQLITNHHEKDKIVK